MKRHERAVAPTKRELKILASEAEQAGNPALAEDALERAFEIDPDDIDIVIRLMRILIGEKKVSRAQELAEAKLQRHQDRTRLVKMYIQSDVDSHTIADCLDDVRAKLVAYPHQPAVRARAAIAFAWHGDIDQAKAHAGAAILGASTLETSDFIRLVLARRLLNFGFPDTADWICRLDRVGKGQEPTILYDRLLIRTSNAANDATTHRLFQKLLKLENFPRRSDLVEEHVDFLWRFNGPSYELIREIDNQLRLDPDADSTSFLLMKVALAMQLGDEGLALHVLRERPDLAGKFSTCLPVAKLVEKHNLSDRSQTSPDLPEYAALYDKLADSDAVLRRRLGDPAVTCAVVGNSSCEIGSGNGDRIDRHDEVVRFNRFRTDPPFDKDYGRKSTVLVRAANDKSDIGNDLLPNTLIIISSGSTLYRGRAWRAAKRLQSEGHTLCVFPQKIHTELSQMLSASPSSGLSFVYLLKKIRNILNRANFFGFSFTDQIGPKPSSSHYFELAKPSTVHRWDKEREIFDGLFEART